MTEQAPLVLTAGGIVAVPMWLMAFGLYIYQALRMEGATARLTTANLLTRIGLLIGTAGWSSYVALTWPQLPWRMAFLPPVALAALVVHTVLGRRISGSPLSLCLYSCAVVAYGAALAPFQAEDVAEASITLPAFVLGMIREIVAAVAAGALLAYGMVLLLRCYPTQALDTSRAEHLGDGTLRIALVAVTVTLATAMWRAWSMWGEIARTDVTTLFIAWVFIMAASLWQMMTGMIMTRVVHILALSALVLLMVMLVLVA